MHIWLDDIGHHQPETEPCYLIPSIWGGENEVNPFLEDETFILQALSFVE